MNSIMERTFAESVERELAAIGTGRSRLQRTQRRMRATTIAVGSLALVGSLTGASVMVLNGLPGETEITPAAEEVTGSHTGTAEIELGPVPAGADRIVLDITCSDGGVMEVPTRPGQGAGASSVSWNCSDPREGDTVHIQDALLPAGCETGIVITAAPGTSWTYVARYASSVTSDWGVNDSGETFGVPNDSGVPDLIRAQATNGESGYIRDSEMGITGCIPVYESDGATKIGLFPNGAAEGECDTAE
ncbi:hypothetical protein [Streptomyces sp. AC495_CC817]|uniref:hypothetical protein n=1 Tax=Streptomyces sp. AC495_CC817 TaxID=2823900 RepID=UPI001C25EA18|nr:hypothetical protein [Streptomyces sp. AC495_CC817]